MERFFLIVLLCAGCIAGDTLTIGNKAIITAEDFRDTEDYIKEKIIWYQNNPFAPEADSILEILYTWVDKVPYLKIHADVCYMPEFYLKRGEYPYYVKVFWAYTYGKLLYKLEHPRRFKQEDLVYSAFTSMLSTYRSMKNLKNNAVSGYFDRFEEIYRNGKLEDYIEKIGRIVCRGE